MRPSLHLGQDTVLLVEPGVEAVGEGRQELDELLGQPLDLLPRGLVLRAVADGLIELVAGRPQEGGRAGEARPHPGQARDGRVDAPPGLPQGDGHPPEPLGPPERLRQVHGQPGELLGEAGDLVGQLRREPLDLRLSRQGDGQALAGRADRLAALDHRGLDLGQLLRQAFDLAAHRRQARGHLPHVGADLGPPGQNGRFRTLGFSPSSVTTG